jgi:hypothetical protein
VATDHEISHGRDIIWTLLAKQAPEHITDTRIGTSWLVEVRGTGTRGSKPFCATHLFLSSLRTTPEALLQLVRERWGIEGWHWIRTPSSKRMPTATGATGPERCSRCAQQHSTCCG